jgi:hypothetical protein
VAANPIISKKDKITLQRADSRDIARGLSFLSVKFDTIANGGLTSLEDVKEVKDGSKWAIKALVEFWLD